MVQEMQDTASATAPAVASNTVSAVAGSGAPDAIDMGTVRKRNGLAGEVPSAE